MTDSTLAPVAPAPSLRALLSGLGGRHRLKLAFTYTLSVTENGLNVLYPFLTGLAIDGVLSGAWIGVAPLLVTWSVHLAVGLFRHLYDTRVFTLMLTSRPASSSGRELRARTPLTSPHA